MMQTLAYTINFLAEGGKAAGDDYGITAHRPPLCGREKGIRDGDWDTCRGAGTFARHRGHRYPADSGPSQ
jgi:hypothetical protein